MIKILDLNFQGISEAISAFIVESSAGPVLVETGPYSCFDQLSNQLEYHNIAINDIKHVLITHIHLDHAGAAWALAKKGAKIYLHPFGEAHMKDPERLWQSAKMIYGDEMEKLWGEMQAIDPNHLAIMEHGEVVKIGELDFTAWHTPGHANHHIAWQVNNALFAGDVAGVKINGGPVVPPCPPPDINLEKWKNSIELINTLEIDTLYLTHFGVINDINNHLDELWETLNSWSNWIKPKFENNEKVEAITPDFQKFTAQQLIDKGVDKLGLKQYETANPTWMSVAGLMRYWKKASAAKY